MADKNSSPRKLLFFLFLLIVSTIRLCKSDPPQNIEVHFPPPSPPLPPPPPPSPPPPPIEASPPGNLTPSPESSPAPPSNKKKIAAAVGATAASTLILTGLAFFVIQRMIVAKRKRESDSPVAGVPGSGGGGGSAMALQSRSQFVRYQGEVKGFIVDENGLDVLYWRKLEKRNNASNALRKEVLKNNSKNNKAIQEVPLLRERSSTSHLVDQEDDRDLRARVSNHNPQHHNGVVFREPEVLSSRSSSVSGPPPESLPPTPPPPPIPPPPPPPPAKKALVPPPPPPKLRSVNAGAKPPTAPPAKGKSAAETAEIGGQVKMKALHWDKVNMANSDHSMVWDKINSQSGSFRYISNSYLLSSNVIISINDSSFPRT